MWKSGKTARNSCVSVLVSDQSGGCLSSINSCGISLRAELFIGTSDSLKVCVVLVLCHSLAVQTFCKHRSLLKNEDKLNELDSDYLVENEAGLQFFSPASISFLQGSGLGTLVASMCLEGSLVCQGRYQTTQEATTLKLLPW